VNTAASKVLSCVPKGVNEMFCVETIRNLQGQVVPNALVAFSRTPLGNIDPDAAKVGTLDTRGQVVVANTDTVVTLRTNGLGEAGVVVTESLTPPNPNSCVDVKAENLGTAFPTAQQGVFNPAIKVFQQVTPATGQVGCGALTTGSNSNGTTVNTPAAGGGGSTATNAPTSNPAQQQQPTNVTSNVVTQVPTNTAASAGVEAQTTIVTLNATTTPAQVAKAATASRGTLAYVKVVYKQQTGRHLLVRVNGKASTARLLITLKNAQGTVVQKAVRFVATNKQQTVKNLTLSAKVKSVAVSVS